MKMKKKLSLKLLMFFIAWQVSSTCFCDNSELDAEKLTAFEHLVTWLKDHNVPYSKTGLGVRIIVKEQTDQAKEAATVTEEGMLVIRNANDFVAYTDEMRLLTVSSQQGQVTVSVEEVKLTDVVRRRLDAPQSFSESNVRGFCWERGVEFGDIRSSQSLDLKCRELLLAYWCHELGEVELRNRLLHSVFQTGSRVDGTNLVRFFSDRYSSCLLDRAIVSIANIQISHDRIADRIEWIDRTFWKQGAQRQKVTDLVIRLRKISNIAGISYKPGKALDEEALVGLLCQQRCADCSIDHGYNFEYVHIDSGHISPAAALLLSGPKATPALLKAIGDRTPTRRVLDSGLHVQGPVVDTVGAMAVDLLERVLGQPRLPYLREPESIEEIEQTRAAFQDLLENKTTQ